MFVYFIVGKNGVVRDVKGGAEVDPRLDEEAVRVVEYCRYSSLANNAVTQCLFSSRCPVKFIAQPMKSEGQEVKNDSLRVITKGYVKPT